MFIDGIHFLLKGGFTMGPLFVCAVLSIGVILERVLYLRRVTRGADELGQRIHELLESGRDDEATRILTSNEGPVARMLEYAIRNRQLDLPILERKLEEIALEETPKLSLRLSWLDTIITIAPLLGLLGTVTGMIRAFHVVGDPSTLSGPAAITGDIAEALIATATGLTVAIVTLVGYNGLGEKVKEVISKMELAATQALNVFAARTPASLGSEHENSKTRA
jgi:biopolymer transport protein ExbB